MVFVGKTLTAHGGQNPVEPVAAGRPVIFGPNMENFATLARSLVQGGGAVQVANEAELRESAARLLRDEPARRRLVENARNVTSSPRWRYSADGGSRHASAFRYSHRSCRLNGRK